MKKALTFALLGALAISPAWATGGSQRSSEMQGGQSWQSGSRQQQSMNQDTVRQVQEQLQNQGYDVGSVDGQMGPRTQQALRQFQQDQNLPASGNADQRTMAALGVERGSNQQAQTPDDQQQRMDQRRQQREDMDQQQQQRDQSR